jgi:hypothetical protein
VIALRDQRLAADLWFGVLGAALVGCAFAFAAFGTPPFVPAPITAIGVPSPLTGMTRSFVALAGGDLSLSFLFHPLGPLCFLACVAAIGNTAVILRTGHRARLVENALRVRSAPLVVGLAFTVVWIRQIAVFA